jgi:hypothetical protein
MLSDSYCLVEEVRIARDRLHELLKQIVVRVNEMADALGARLDDGFDVSVKEFGELSDLTAGQLVDGAWLESAKLFEEGLALSKELGKFASGVLDAGSDFREGCLKLGSGGKGRQPTLVRIELVIVQHVAALRAMLVLQLVTRLLLFILADLFDHTGLRTRIRLILLHNLGSAWFDHGLRSGDHLDHTHSVIGIRVTVLLLFGWCIDRCRLLQSSCLGLLLFVVALVSRFLLDLGLPIVTILRRFKHCKALGHTPEKVFILHVTHQLIEPSEPERLVSLRLQLDVGLDFLQFLDLLDVLFGRVEVVETDLVEEVHGFARLEAGLLLQLEHLRVDGIEFREVDREGLAFVVKVSGNFRIHTADVLVIRVGKVVLHQLSDRLERQLVRGLDSRLHCDFVSDAVSRRSRLFDQTLVILVHFLGDDDRLTVVVVTALLGRHVDLHRLQVTHVLREYVDLFLDCRLHRRLLLLALCLSQECLGDVTELGGRQADLISLGKHREK